MNPLLYYFYVDILKGTPETSLYSEIYIYICTYIYIHTPTYVYVCLSIEN